MLSRNEIIAKIKLAIKNLNQPLLDKTLDDAIEAYTASSSSLLAVMSLGIYGASKRKENLKLRIAAKKMPTTLPHELIIALLKDEKTGESMKSFKYFLVSKLTGIEVSTDEQVKVLIDLAIRELENPNFKMEVERKNAELLSRDKAKTKLHVVAESFLENNDLLTTENISMLESMKYGSLYFSSMADIFVYLNEAKILNQINFNLIINGANEKSLDWFHNFNSATKRLSENKFLTQDNFELLATTKYTWNSSTISYLIIELNKIGILSKEMLNRILNQDNSTFGTKCSEVGKGLTYLNEANLLSEPYIDDVIKSERPHKVGVMIYSLVKSGMFNESNYEKAKKCLNANEVGFDTSLYIGNVTLTLVENKLLNQEIFDELAKYKPHNFEDLSWIFGWFHGDDHKFFYTEESNRQVSTDKIPFLIRMLILEHHPKPKDLYTVVKLLKNSGLLNKRNLDISSKLIISSEHTFDARVFEYLFSNDMLTQENFDIITDNHEIRGLIYRLNANKILNTENFDVIKAHAFPKNISAALICLNSASILTYENREAIKGFECFYMVRYLKDVNFLNQHTLNQSIQYGDIIFSQRMDTILSWIPDGQFNQALFDRIIEFCNQANGNVERAHQSIWNHVVQVFNLQPHQQAEGIQGAQTTHTASVHRTASESAKRLKENYYASLEKQGLEKVILEVRNWINLAFESDIGNPVRKAAYRLTALGYDFTDPGSQVSTRLLLALVWNALLDDSKRQGTVEDAKKLLMTAFYEIQREYNLDEASIDKGGVDAPACSAGTFNKILEKMQGVLPDVHLEFITKATAALKMKAVVNEEAIKYLSSLPKDENYKKLLDLMKGGEGVGPIWDEIKDSVANRIYDEFESIFPLRNEFNQDIDAGQYYVIDPAKLETQQKPSFGLFAPQSVSQGSSSEDSVIIEEKKDEKMPNSSKEGP